MLTDEQIDAIENDARAGEWTTYQRARAIEAAILAGQAAASLGHQAERLRGEPVAAEVEFDTACRVVRSTKRASISTLQLHMRIGYNRAYRLIEQLEAAGVISAPDDRGRFTVTPTAPDAHPEALEPDVPKHPATQATKPRG